VLLALVISFSSAIELTGSAFHICKRFNEAYYAPTPQAMLTHTSSFLAHVQLPYDDLLKSPEDLLGGGVDVLSDVCRW
jgi:hypothetical protein